VVHAFHRHPGVVGGATFRGGARHFMLATGSHGAVPVLAAPERLTALLGLLERRSTLAGNALIAAASEQGSEDHQPAGHDSRAQSRFLLDHL
jgi:hypothetical protein